MKIKRKLMPIIMAFAIVIMSVTPIWADAQARQMAFSDWAIQTLNEGEKYGVFSQEWYYEGFLETVTSERLTILLGALDQRLGEIGVMTGFKPLPTANDFSRGDVMTHIFNVLGKHGFVSGTDAIKGLQDFGVVAGTGAGLALEQACTTEQAVLMVINAVQKSFLSANAGGKGFFWQVSSGENTVYLLGSIHLATASIYPFHQMLIEAYKASDVLVVEANVLDVASGIEYFNAKSMLESGTSLKDILDEETYEKLGMVLSGFGYPTDAYDSIKPWRVANDLNALLMTLSGGDASEVDNSVAGIDLYFILNAFLNGKPIYELEGVPYQADLFDGLSKEFQVQYLQSVLEGFFAPAEEGTSQSAEQLNAWLALWKEGDLDAFRESFSLEASEDNELTQMLFGQRDIDMTEKIIMMLENENPATYFVVVGAGHLVPDNSIVDLLRKAGYTVTWMYQ